jgi:hypothetical protein
MKKAHIYLGIDSIKIINYDSFSSDFEIKSFVFVKDIGKGYTEIVAIFPFNHSIIML